MRNKSASKYPMTKIFCHKVPPPPCMCPDGRLLVWQLGRVQGGGAGGGSPDGEGGALPQVLPDAAGMVCALIAAYWYGGRGTTTGPLRPAPSAQGWHLRTEAAHPLVTRRAGIGVASRGLCMGAKGLEATLSPLPAATGRG